MKPTFRVGDLLWTAPCSKDEVCMGDVIVFTLAEEVGFVVHRVVDVSREGFRTRGDGNSQDDPWMVGWDRVVGRVMRAQRIGAIRTVEGGLYGRIYAGVLRTGRRCNAKASAVLHPFYHWLAEKGWCRSFVPSCLKPRILRFAKSSGVECQLYLGRSVIGRLHPGADRWHIRRPFRLLVDEASLPRGARAGE